MNRANNALQVGGPERQADGARALAGVSLSDRIVLTMVCITALSCAPLSFLSAHRRSAFACSFEYEKHFRDDGASSLVTVFAPL